MHWNQWTLMDVVFIAIILVSTGFAVRKGLAREVISLVALFGGFILAACYYPAVARWFLDVTRTEAIANLIGFLAIFLASLLIGAVAAFLVNRFIKMASLEWIDRLMGAVFGFLRGWAVASIVALALIAFPLRQNTLARSVFAPYLLAGARAAVLLVPQQLKLKFNEEYQKILQTWNHNRSSV
ncbi:MAG: CvpA family protein [Acidobacteriia bacterium]|nr:CvpA family protein [Terriglobia bacterium]